MTEKPFALVLMPFSSDFDDIYRLGIREAAKEHDVIAERVDEQLYSETMMERIYRQIDAADFVIADMTGRNPNVFYEVGYAHAKGKLCTLLTQDTADIPFDLKHHRHLVYGGKISRLRELLSPELQWLKAETEKKNTSPFSVEMKTEGLLVKSEHRADAELTLRFDLYNRTKRRSADIEAIYLQTGRIWTFKQNGEKCASSDIDKDTKRVRRHFVKAPVTRLPPDSWAQIEVVGSAMMWSKYHGDEPVKDVYPLRGYLVLEIVTSDGLFTEKFNIDMEIDEFPF
ncbi:MULTISPECIES: nucleoside 2-deoxyribosyltransferase [unclassified Rhizobium]|uniref:nucleoside 2-deoxyribosyltransferase n=1 Tax=unclassified Rhizobium TaxID=2613769 RepID=UPI0007EA0BFE|nr:MULTISPECIES: nucleoside 2-deoxyribosyltransferase [unclassified Rhizobium]ANK84458.1 hypothetical protein AMK02_CH00821 [Rhizobium sp. N731]ANL14706.1 hypothetical protein AMJ97_CH00821 [Rhizobium sp. N1314]